MRISDWSSDVCSSDLAEVASIGGMVRQYQIIVDPQKLAAFGVTAPEVADALKRANQESGGGSLELAEAEYIVRARSEERRGGKEWVKTCRSRGSPYQ